jgi:hypothetical protein
MHRGSNNFRELRSAEECLEFTKLKVAKRRCMPHRRKGLGLGKLGFAQPLGKKAVDA